MGLRSEIPLGTGPTFAPDLLPAVTRLRVFRKHLFLERLATTSPSAHRGASGALPPARYGADLHLPNEQCGGLGPAPNRRAPTAHQSAAGEMHGVHGVDAIAPRIYWFYLYLFTPVPHWSTLERVERGERVLQSLHRHSSALWSEYTLIEWA